MCEYTVEMHMCECIVVVDASMCEILSDHSNDIFTVMAFTWKIRMCLHKKQQANPREHGNRASSLSPFISSHSAYVSFTL